MIFKGGVIIIGSLLWDENPIRHKWRSLNLKDTSTKQLVSVPIRYGRKSSSRNNTYTMIFSNNNSTQQGQAYLLGFKTEIKNAKALQTEAFALGAAEGLWKETPSINNTWGSVGLLMNPKIDAKNKNGADIIRQWWVQQYQAYDRTFDYLQYKIEDNELPVIDKDGFLKIPWSDDMNDYDLLIATPVVPSPKRLLTPKEIAERMKVKHYRTYFDRNTENNIRTFQDDEIAEYLNK